GGIGPLLEAQVACKPAHPVIRRRIDGVEPLDAFRAGVLDQTPEQQRRETLVLPRVGDRDGDLGLLARGLRRRVTADADVLLAFRRARDGDIGHLAGLVRRAETLELRVAELSDASEEQQVLALRGQVFEERGLRVLVVRPDRPYRHARPVPQRLDRRLARYR